MRTLLAGTLALTALIAAPRMAAAHHSATMFDNKKIVTMKGVVKEFQLTNPHSWLLVDVKNLDGSVTTWGFEAEGPNTLLQAKIRRGDFTPGAEITISGFPMKDGRPAAAWTKAVKADGAEFYPRGRNPQIY